MDFKDLSLHAVVHVLGKLGRCFTKHSSSAHVTSETRAAWNGVMSASPQSVTSGTMTHNGSP